MPNSDPPDRSTSTVRVGSEVVAKGQVPVSAPLLFTANDCLDIGCLPRLTGVGRLLRQGALPLRGSDRPRPRGIHLTCDPADPLCADSCGNGVPWG